MRSPRSSAQLAADVELKAAAEAALHAAGYYNPIVVRAERVRDGEVEVLYHVEMQGGRRAARTAWIRTDQGAPSVTAVVGWPVV